jgi:hypothetical protein
MKTLSDNQRRNANAETNMTIYPDTNLLKPYIKQDVKEEQACEQLEPYVKTGQITIVGSNASRRDFAGPQHDPSRSVLETSVDELGSLTADHKFLGLFSSTDPYGGFCVGPLVSDIPDDRVHSQLLSFGLHNEDAKLLTVALHNRCDVFLTRDQHSILKHRGKIEAHFTILVMKPSELLKRLECPSPAITPQ